MMPIMTSSAGRLVLVRHGQTEWSRDGRHTGLTDLPLLPEGEEDARSLAEHLARFPFARVLTSDLGRARRTAELAGLEGEVDVDLREWDYGAAEGRTTAEIREEEGPSWTVFDGVPTGASPGETVEEGRDVALVGHGHALRILTAVWLGHAPRLAAQLVLDAGAVSILGFYREDPCVIAWNVPVGGLAALV